MMAHTHMLFALLLVTLSGVALGEPLEPLLLAPAVLGALLPDIDQPRSMMGRVTRPLSTLLNRVVGHRTLTHSLMGLAGVSIIVAVPVQQFALGTGALLAFAAGYGSHILADMLNRSGVALLYPAGGRVSLLPKRLGIGTGSVTEALLSVALLGALSLTFLKGL